MYSIKFPDFISSSNLKLVSDKEATRSNLKLLLLSEKGSLFGDPYFGTNLRKIIFSNNSDTLQDLIVDEIYTAVRLMMPQITLERSGIEVYTDGLNIYTNLNYIDKLDYSTNLYNINLTNE